MTQGELVQKGNEGKVADESQVSDAHPAAEAPASENAYTLQDFVPLLQFIPFLFQLRDSDSLSSQGRSHGAASTSISGGFTLTKVQLNTNDFATGITWDGTNHRFTVTSQGIYAVTGTVGYQSTTSGKQYHALIYKNGSEVTRGGLNSSASTYLSPSATDLLKLNIGDYIELYTEHNDTSPNSIYNTSPLTYLTIHKV